MYDNLPPYVLKRNARSRHIRIRVLSGGQVFVSAPERVSERSVRSFLESKRAWLWSAVTRLKRFPEQSLSLRDEKKLFAVHKEKALLLAEVKVRQWNEMYQFHFGKISIRNSRSRWGSCSSKGTLSFNYKIVFLPKHLADYLVVHELCHLKEHNHSKGFWSFVAQTIPEYVVRRRELRKFDCGKLRLLA